MSEEIKKEAKDMELNPEELDKVSGGVGSEESDIIEGLDPHKKMRVTSETINDGEIVIQETPDVGDEIIEGLDPHTKYRITSKMG